MMDNVYNVTINTTGEKNIFNITWLHRSKKTASNFNQPGPGITAEELEKQWQQPGTQLKIGQELFRFLDGDAHYLQQALDKTSRQGESLILYLHTCSGTSDWPFELLARDKSFLLPYRIHLMRCVSEWGSEKKVPPQNRPLKLLFMACSALDVEPELDFEKEEETIFQVTEKLAVDMEIEDSGSLAGLRQQLGQEKYDIVHLSGHADIDENGRPFFIMEDETGCHEAVFPYQLWEEALIENPVQLLFLSGCRTGETPEKGAAVSFARSLVEKHHVPAVLGWGRSVSDEQATHAEEMIYKELSRGKSILEAVQRARFQLITNFPLSQHPAWFFLRLFSGGEPLQALVTKGQRKRPHPRRIKHTYLKNSRVKVLSEGFVGRRRQLQQSLRTLKNDYEKIGLLLHGTGGLGKSCLAGKICERFTNHTLIIVHGKFNTITMEQALKDAFLKTLDETGEKILAAEKEMPEKLAKLCVTSFKEKNYLIILDDFEQNLEGFAEGQPGSLLPEAAELLKVLLHCLPFSEKMTQLIVTCRYLFSMVLAHDGSIQTEVITSNKNFCGGPGGGFYKKSPLVAEGKNKTEQNLDMVKERLESICLTSFQDAEQRKKVRELKYILNYPIPSISLQLLLAGRGNPRLMEWLDLLVGQLSEVEVSQLLAAVKDKQEEFIRSHVIRKLVQRGGKELESFLRWFSIYRQPVFIQGARQVGEKAGLEQWQELLEKGLGLSLVEHDRARESYGVTPLLREELLTGLDPVHLQPCHQAAFTYYKETCEDMEIFDPLLAEEWIYHALECGEQEVASRQGGRLVNHLRERLAFRESRRVGEWVLAEKKRKKQELSTGHDAFLLNALAYTINDIGGYRKAIAYYKQALDIWKKVHGERHQDVAVALNNLGEAWRVLGEPLKAIDYYEQALDIDEAVFGKEHPNVAIRLNNLGAAWQVLGDNRKAIDYYEQALDIDEAVFGLEHPKVAIRLNNLGLTWQALGDNRKTIAYYEQALDICKKVYDEMHPQLATALNNLGGAWQALGDNRKAIDYFEQALDIDEAMFGPEHPNVAYALNNLGGAWEALGDKGKALAYYEKAYGIFKKFFGEEHPNTKLVKKNWELCKTSKT